MRRVLSYALVAVVVLVGGVAAVAGWVWHRAAISTVDEVDFARPLAIPPLAESTTDEAGRRVFTLTAGEGSHDLGQGRRSATYGFNGDFLGPTLRAARGEEVVVDVHNRIAEQTTVHWHGMELPAAMDGGPHQPVAPGGSWSPSWVIEQPAATLWYHPHPHGRTAGQVYRGLAGMFIVDDEESDSLPLPREYGVDDIPVMVQDLSFTGDGQLDERPGLVSGVGVLGGTIAVNGTVGPYLEVTTELVRLRLLNASMARVYDFGFADDRSFALVGTDGGLLGEPHRTDRVMLSPGERAEIVVAMAPGEQVVLRSTAPPLGIGFWDRMVGGADTLDILELRAAPELAASPPVPDRLAEIAGPEPSEVATTRGFTLSGHHINGARMDPGRVDAVVEAGSVEVWQVSSAEGMPHNVHLHGVRFQVLAVAGQAPPPQLRGWKDTLYLPTGVTFDLIIQFPEHADPDVPYMLHCHLLFHEDAGMMAQFVVVAPGQQAGDVDHSHG